MRKEIVAKTIQKRLNKEYSSNIAFDFPASKVLGCWIINDVIRITQGDVISVSGSFDLHSWVGYELNSNSKVLIERHEFELKIHNPLPNGTVIVSFGKPPYCDKYELSENKVIYTVKFSYCLEWICDTKLYIEVSNDELDNLIDLQVNEDYIENE